MIEYIDFLQNLRYKAYKVEIYNFFKIIRTSTLFVNIQDSVYIKFFIFIMPLLNYFHLIKNHKYSYILFHHHLAIL